ncbi:MAG: type II secretion system protein [Verrucomicrobiales bacterium]
MKWTEKLKSARGFSLVELLVVIAVIGLIAAIALPSVSKITDKARKATAQKNAQMLCSLHTNAKSAGAGFSATTRGGILDELVVGVTGTIVATDFKMSELSEKDKAEALKYCSYDAPEGMMSYYPDGNAPADDEGDGGWEKFSRHINSDFIDGVLDLTGFGFPSGYEYRLGDDYQSDPMHSFDEFWIERRLLP